MSPLSSHPGRHLLDGTLRVFLAGLLFPLTGLITAAFLTRRLGTDGYGLLVLSATLYGWMELAINSFFARAATKFVGESKDWRPVGMTVIRLQWIFGLGGGLLLGLLSLPLAWLFEEPLLAPYLALYAFHLPISALAHGHQTILVGIGQFRQKAVSTACRWLARLVFILLLVELGLSVPGAILGSLGASIAELAISRRYVNLPLLGKLDFSPRPFYTFGLLLCLASVCFVIFSNMGLVMLKMLGGTIRETGIYGAAQNLSILPGLFGTSFSPLLLATLSRLLSDGEAEQAKAMSRGAMRFVVGLLPFGAMIAGTANELVVWVFGESFEAGGPILGVLILGAIAFVMITIAVVIVTAAGYPRFTVLLSGPLVLLVLVGNLLLIPSYGALGAAAVTALCQGLGALIAIFFVYRLWGIIPPISTLGRSLVLSLLAYNLAANWQVAGLLLLFKLGLIGLIITLGFWVLREFTAAEMAWARNYLNGRPEMREHQSDV